MVQRIIFFFFGMIPLLGNAQSQFAPMASELLPIYQNNKDFSFTSVQPQILSRIDFYYPKSDTSKNLFIRKLRSESLIEYKKENFTLSVDPYFDIHYGKDFFDKSSYGDTTHLYQNARGIAVNGSWSDKCSFQTNFIENQSFFTLYQRNYVQNTGVVPGSGRVKPFKNTGFDYAAAFGYFNYAPSKNQHFSVGNGKAKFGQGYRSLFLSDYSFNSPYIRSNSLFLKGRINYVFQYNALKNLQRVPYFNTVEAPFIPKTGSFFFLELKLHKRIKLAFFEGNIWQRWDSTGTKKLPAHFYAPLIGLNSVINGLNNQNNSLVGGQLSVNPFKNTCLYGQYLLDKPSGKGDGYQLGVKQTGEIGAHFKYHVLLEHNNIAKLSYSHANHLQSYSNYNEALAHPMGSGFREFLLKSSFLWKGVFINFDIIRAYYAGKYYAGNVPGINMMEHSTRYMWDANFNTTTALNNNRDLQLDYLKTELGYEINSKTHLRLLAGLLYRVETEKLEMNKQQTRFIYFGFRTSISNYYFDF